MSPDKVTVRDIEAKYQAGEPIVMVTAYDYAGALIVEEAQLDILLVGDSLANVMMGLETTTPVTMEEMLHHCRMVARGARTSFLIGDMPFLSYQLDTVSAVRNAGRFLKEAGMDAVKLEGGAVVADAVRAIVRAGIPVMGHVGLTPQTVSQLGGFKVQANTAISARELLDDALALEAAGCFAIVLEAIPARVADQVTARLNTPTIGIGAGPGCSGQVLVFHDMLGLIDRPVARFVKRYANLREQMVAALRVYGDEVRNHAFPAEEHTYKIRKEELDAFVSGLD